MIAFGSTPPCATVQDLGRPGRREEGVPPGGALDPWSLQLANVLAGNDPAAAGIEFLLGGGRLQFRRAAAFALVGTSLAARLGGRAVADRQLLFATKGEWLEIDSLIAGRAFYLAVAGGIDVPVVLESRSTYLPAGFGGLAGRRLQAGDALPLGKRSWPPPRFHPAWLADCPWQMSPSIRFVPSPLWEQLPATWRHELAETPPLATNDLDRVGARFLLHSPPPLPMAVAPSEGAVPGMLQVLPNGRLLVLLADGPTVGGYPKIGVVTGLDLGRLIQCRSGQRAPLAVTTVAQAQDDLRRAQGWLLDLQSRVRGERD